MSLAVLQNRDQPEVQLYVGSFDVYVVAYVATRVSSSPSYDNNTIIIVFVLHVDKDVWKFLFRYHTNY